MWWLWLKSAKENGNVEFGGCELNRWKANLQVNARERFPPFRILCNRIECFWCSDKCLSRFSMQLWCCCCCYCCCQRHCGLDQCWSLYMSFEWLWSADIFYQSINSINLPLAGEVVLHKLYGTVNHSIEFRCDGNIRWNTKNSWIRFFLGIKKARKNSFKYVDDAMEILKFIKQRSLETFRNNTTKLNLTNFWHFRGKLWNNSIDLSSKSSVLRWRAGESSNSDPTTKPYWHNPKPKPLFRSGCSENRLVRELKSKNPEICFSWMPPRRHSAWKYLQVVYRLAQSNKKINE